MRWLVLLLWLPLLALDVEVTAPSAILINAHTGKILFEKASAARHYPASTTKIATAKFALEMAGDRLEELVETQPDALIVVDPTEKRAGNFAAPSHWNETDGVRMGLSVGDRLPLWQLLCGLLLDSGNDAANVIGQHLSGSAPAFVAQLNRRLLELGFTDTHYTNPHGLHHPNHLSTVHETALIMRWAWGDPRLRELLRSDGRILGYKTGYHAAAGYNLAAVAEQDGRTLIAVVFGCRNAQARFDDVDELFDVAFAEEAQMRHIPAADRRFRLKRISATPAADFNLPVYPSEDGPIHLVTVWEVPEGRISKGAPVGQLQATTEDGVVLASVPLLATRSVGKGFSDVRLWLIGGSALLLCWFLRPRRRRP